MPYTKEHKEKSRIKILKSAFKLFSEKGFNVVTIDMVMNNCNLTRGAFYGHFTSKSDLYKNTLTYAASHTNLVKLKPINISSKKWLDLLLDQYLSVEHIQGITPCPLAFMAIDIGARDNQTKSTYESIFIGMNKLILDLVLSYTKCDENKILAITSMLIGTVAIARTLDNQELIINLLSSSRNQIRILLE